MRQMCAKIIKSSSASHFYLSRPRAFFLPSIKISHAVPRTAGGTAIWRSTASDWKISDRAFRASVIRAIIDTTKIGISRWLFSIRRSCRTYSCLQRVTRDSNLFGRQLSEIANFDDCLTEIRRAHIFSLPNISYLHLRIKRYMSENQPHSRAVEREKYLPASGLTIHYVGELNLPFNGKESN